MKYATWKKQGTVQKYDRHLEAVRTVLCQSVGVAEEIVPLSSMWTFFSKHGQYCQLPLRYTDAQVLSQVVPRNVVDPFRIHFRTSTLADSAYLHLNGEYFRNADWLASTHKYVISPMESSLACQVCAYAMLKCEENFERLVWYRSQLSTRLFVDKFPKTDFAFWTMYGSLSFCADCGSLHFNDKYFSEVVYQTARTTEKPEFMAMYRRLCPTDAVEHSPSQIGVSSRWWYLAGMYKPVSHCGACTRPSGQSAGAAFSQALYDARQRHFDSAVQSTSQ